MPDLRFTRAEQLRRNLLGRGLQTRGVTPGFDLGIDLVLSRGPRGLDFAQVTDMDNLEQGLTLALTTALGSDVFNSDFGFDGLNAIAEESDPVLMRERIRISIIQLLQKDPRIKNIIDVRLDNGLRNPSPTSRGQDQADRMAGRGTLDVTVEFETHTGDRGQLTVNQVKLNAR